MSDSQPKTLGYGRASTRKQEDSTDTQKDHIKRYAVFNQLGDVTFFIDNATSGKLSWDERPAGKEFFRQLQKGDNVVISKLDRAFRRLADCCNTLERFKRIGVRLHVCNLMGGAIDLSSPMGCFLVQILAAFAELERAFISERTKDGLAKRKLKGVRHSRFPGYGFQWESRRTSSGTVKVKVVDETEREVMRCIVQWVHADEPWSFEDIADHIQNTLKIPTKDGSHWNHLRVRRAYRAELKLMQDEAKARTAAREP